MGHGRLVSGADLVMAGVREEHVGPASDLLSATRESYRHRLEHVSPRETRAHARARALKARKFMAGAACTVVLAPFTLPPSATSPPQFFLRFFAMLASFLGAILNLLAATAAECGLRRRRTCGLTAVFPLPPGRYPGRRPHLRRHHHLLRRRRPSRRLQLAVRAQREPACFGSRACMPPPQPISATTHLK